MLKKLIGTEKLEGVDCLLVDQYPYYKFVDGVKVENDIAGITYEVIFPTLKYEKCNIKIEGIKTSKIKLEEDSEPILINFKGVKITPYINRNSIKLSIKAESVDTSIEIDGGL